MGKSVEIKNKIKRSEVNRKRRAEKEAAKKEAKLRRKREAEALGEEAPPKQVPRTLENTRKADVTTVDPGDEEVRAEQEQDEFARYFTNKRKPKIMVTTRPRPSRHLFPFMSDLMTMLPNTFFYPRRSHDILKMQRWALQKKFTHLIVLGEKKKTCNQMLVIHLGDGPCALFRVTNVRTNKQIKGHGAPTLHLPEIVLSGFTTRLGHRVGRLFGSMFSHNPEFIGRNCVTFHNQRDFIFFRHHRYQFKDDYKGAKLQELGPRFTLKLKWMMANEFDPEHGEYEWILKQKEMKVTKKSFFL